mgnify:FL=1
MSLTHEQARSLLGDDCIGPADVEAALGSEPDSAPPVPYSEAELQAAKKEGDLLIFRTATAGGARLTIAALTERFPQCFESGLLKGAGYALKNEWGILLEPIADLDTCTTGWALVSTDVLPPTLNLSFDEQEEMLGKHLAESGLGDVGVRRRTVVEAVYDTVIVFAARKRRLLEKTWDWTSSRTEDGGWLQVGGFGTKGMQIVSYSRGTRHGALGTCLTRQPAA